MYRVYCDFDATVAERDVWQEIFSRFGTSEAFNVWKDFDTGTKRAADCITAACATVRGGERDAIMRLILEQPLRAGFPEFVAFCAREAIELRLVSDGFSGYIRPILAAHGLESVPVWTNEIELEADGTFSVRFLHDRESCTNCAACKCANILTTSGEADTIVYVGDGYSDVCPVQLADVVFARDELVRYCNRHSIPHHPFHDFHEIRAILSSYFVDRPKYKRTHAARRQKELIMME